MRKIRRSPLVYWVYCGPMITAAPDANHPGVHPAVHPGVSATALELARKVLQIEADAISALIERLGGQFLEAANLIYACRGRVVVSGIGKSGHIARKIASTMASTGTPAFFVHPAEAIHGDLGMIQSDDVLLALSYSGESAELLTIIPAIKREGAKLIAITGNENSTLARQADVHLDARVAQEACRHDRLHAQLPRQSSLVLAIFRSVRFPCGGCVHQAGRRRLLPRV